MKDDYVLVATNNGGDLLFETVKQRLADLPVRVVRMVETRGPRDG